MKKAISLLLALVMCLSLCACGKSVGNTPEEPKATIKTKDGNTEYLTSSELCAIYNENQAKYSSKYQSMEATIIGTVKSVGEHQEYYGSTRKKVYTITLEEKWVITVLAEKHKEVIDFSAGDTVKITSHLQLTGFDGVRMQHIGQSGSKWYDKTTIEVVK